MMKRTYCRSEFYEDDEFHYVRYMNDFGEMVEQKTVKIATDDTTDESNGNVEEESGVFHFTISESCQLHVLLDPRQTIKAGCKITTSPELQPYVEPYGIRYKRKKYPPTVPDSVFLTSEECEDLLRHLCWAKDDMSEEGSENKLPRFTRLTSSRRKSIYIGTAPILDQDVASKTCTITTFGIMYGNIEYSQDSFELGKIHLNYEQICKLVEWGPKIKEFMEI
jgi:hypothetical protein